MADRISDRPSIADDEHTGAEAAPPLEGVAGGAPSKAAHALSPRRRRSAESASRIVAFAASAEGSHRAVARSLGVAHTTVERWADPEHAAAMTLRDVLAAARAGQGGFARSVLVAMLASVDAARLRPPRRSVDEHLRHLVSGSGSLATAITTALADGRIDDAERAALDRELGRLLGTIEAFRADLKRRDATLPDNEGNSGMAQPNQLPKAVATGKLLKGLADIDCYVLDDGRRVLSQRGIVAGLIGGAGTGDLDRYIARIPNVSEELAAAPEVEFTLEKGGRALGREAVVFVDICQAYVRALADGSLHPSQVQIAIRCASLIGAFAKVGIESLVDEATGYQASREEHHLERRLRLFLRDEATKWELMWPESLVAALSSLWGLAWTGGRHPLELRGVYGKIYDIVLGEDVTSELRERNDDPAVRHHQFLEKPARNLFAGDLRSIELIARQSATRADFWARMRTHFRNEPLQMWIVPPPDKTKKPRLFVIDRGHRGREEQRG